MATNNSKIVKLKQLIAEKILDELVNMDDDATRLPEQITIDWADLYTEEERIAIREGPKKRNGQCPTCKYIFYSKDASQLYCSGARCDNPQESSVGIELCEVVLTKKIVRMWWKWITVAHPRRQHPAPPRLNMLAWVNLSIVQTLYFVSPSRATRTVACHCKLLGRRPE